MTKKKLWVEQQKAVKLYGGIALAILLVAILVHLVNYIAPAIPEKPSFENSYDSFAWDMNYLLMAFIIILPFAGIFIAAGGIVDAAFAVARWIKNK